MSLAHPLPTAWTVRLDSRRRPTLPDEVLRAAGLKPGDELRVRVAEEGMLVLETPEHILSRARARVADLRHGGSVVDDFLAERRAEAQADRG